MAEESPKKPTSIQVNVRMPPDWLQVLKELADLVSRVSGKKRSHQDMIRECIKFAYQWLDMKYRQEPGWKYQLIQMIQRYQ